jgi:N-acetylneuraminate synthase
MTVLIIAEAGVNHNGDKAKAFELIEAAAKAGADVVKFQTFKAERLAATSAPKAAYQKETTNVTESQLEMLKKLELPESWHFELKEYADKLDITFISTAFDLQSLAFLETLNLPFYKVPSGEITNGPLLLAFARTGKSIILSTGMATLGEVEQALAILAWGYMKESAPKSLVEIWQHWSEEAVDSTISAKVSLLHCTSQYPTPMAEVNLKAMDTLASAFKLPVGYSDHTEGLLIPVAAVARGAVIIEKHFTLDCTLPGPDHKASLEPSELEKMVQEIRAVENALGSSWKKPQISEWDTRIAARQQIIAVSEIKQGEVFSLSNVGTARAGAGVSPVYVWDLIGKVSKCDYAAGKPII